MLANFYSLIHVGNKRAQHVPQQFQKVWLLTCSQKIDQPYMTITLNLLISHLELKDVIQVSKTMSC